MDQFSGEAHLLTCAPFLVHSVSKLLNKPVLSKKSRKLETTIENPRGELIKKWREGVGVESTRDVYSHILDFSSSPAISCTP